MAVPRRKTSVSRRGARRSGHPKEVCTYVEDQRSGELRRPHHVDMKTGWYNGRQVFVPKQKSNAEENLDPA